MQQNITIQIATLDNLAAIKQCAYQSYNIYVKRIGKQPAPMNANFKQQILDNIIYVAKDHRHNLLGYIVFYPKNQHIFLENIAVSPNHQGRGIGKLLMQYCEAFAKKNGIKTIQLYTNIKMTENITLYPKLGYVETHRQTEDGFERVYFEKNL